MSGLFGITADIGGTIPRTDYKIDELGVTYRILLEYFFSSQSSNVFAIRILGGGGTLKGEVFSNDLIYPPVPDNFNSEFYFFGGGLVYSFIIGNSLPYVSVSASYMYFNPLDENGFKLPNNQFSIYDNGAMIYSIEAGVRFPFSRNWSLNLGADFNFTSTDYFDDIEAGYNNDAFIGFFTGISFYFGKNIDSDNDGIEDNIDLCPNTAEGMEVNEFGCSEMDMNTQDISYDSQKDHFVSDGIFTDDSLFCFQINLFRELNKAEEFRDTITSIGYRIIIMEVNIGGVIWYSVRVGNFNSFESAKFYKEDFYKRTNLNLN